MGNPEPNDNEWLKLTPKDEMPQPEKVAYPKPPKAADGSLIYERIPSKGEVEIIKVPAEPTSPVTLKRRHTEDVNGVGDSKYLRLLRLLAKAKILIFHFPLLIQML